MAGRYHALSEMDIYQALPQDPRGEKPWKRIIVGSEVVYEIRYRRNDYIRVFTSVPARLNSTVRSRGSDAIRICAVRKNANGQVERGLFGHKTVGRVLRLATFAGNLKRKLIKAGRIVRAIQDRGE